RDVAQPSGGGSYAFCCRAATLRGDASAEMTKRERHMGSRRAERLREIIRERADTDKRYVASPRSYRVLAISLYTEQAESVEQTRATLARAGFPRANRSLVIQAAIQRLHEDLKGKSEREVLEYFAE